MNKNYLVVLSALLLVGITFSAVQIIKASADPDPGHTLDEIADFNCPGQCIQGHTGGVLTCVDCSGGTGGYWERRGTETMGSIYPKTLLDKVGIGTTTPQAKLDVNGAIRVGMSLHWGIVETDGFACVDLDSPATLDDDTCGAFTRGMIKIRQIFCPGFGLRDSLCYCGKYQNHPATATGCSGDYCWICLISCP